MKVKAKYEGRSNYMVIAENKEGNEVTATIHVTKNEKKFSRNVVEAFEMFTIQDCDISEREIVEAIQEITTIKIPKVF